MLFFRCGRAFGVQTFSDEHASIYVARVFLYVGPKPIDFNDSLLEGRKILAQGGLSLDLRFHVFEPGIVP